MNPHPTPEDPSGQAVYFFLSYAHVPPPTKGTGRPDHLVRDFFDRLSSRVSEHAAADSRLGGGVYDQSFAVGSDWNAALLRALGTAEVLVPLYSPLYVMPDSWPMTERASFEKRLDAAAGDTVGHIQPVLWMPLAPGETLPSDGVDRVAADVPYYAELGLGALCELPEFQDAYEEVVDQLAQQIVRVAEDSPIGPSSAPTTGRPSTAESRADLVIAVLAPAGASLPAERSAESYGARPSLWTPFAQARPLPIAQAAAAVAERLNVHADIVDLPGNEHRIRRRPVALLVDPWILARPDGEQVLRRTIRSLPPWTLPIVVSDRSDGPSAQRGAELHRRAVAMLPTVPPALVEVNDTERFMNVVPSVVTQARRRFLKRLPATGSGRPRLGRPRLQRTSTEEAGDHD